MKTHKRRIVKNKTRKFFYNPNDPENINKVLIVTGLKVSLKSNIVNIVVKSVN